MVGAAALAGRVGNGELDRAALAELLQGIHPAAANHVVGDQNHVQRTKTGKRQG